MEILGLMGWILAAAAMAYAHQVGRRVEKLEDRVAQLEGEDAEEVSEEATE